MLYQLLQLCAELEMDEEQCLGLVLLASNLAEVLGRNYPTSGAAGGAVGGVWEASQHTHASPHTPAGSAPHALHGSRSLRRDDFTLGGLDRLPGSGVGASGGGLGVSFGAGAGVGSGSMAGLALSLSRAQQGQQQSGAVEHALHAEVASLNHALARLQESRRRHQQGEEVALRETAQLRNSVDAERRQFQRLKHHAHKADLRLQSFEAQQAEIEKLNAIMRTAANALPH
ncbi:hypothetical protein B484DRAFT_444627 [Ochromonadaceae sp. CCMP2298]|nr:hypothetical protein B484DRAFT_444627 [Ochromonadaceae sp. CCMP2298]